MAPSAFSITAMSAREIFCRAEMVTTRCPSPEASSLTAGAGRTGAVTASGAGRAGRRFAAAPLSRTMPAPTQ